MNSFIAPIDKEINWDKSLELVSKTDVYGTILFCNENFANVSGYEEHELAGQPHNIIRHPDMPKVIFKILWNNLNNGKNFNAVIKNLSKSGKYYWVVTNFEILKNENDTIIGYIGRRKGINEAAENTFSKLYEKLKKIENQVGVEAAQEYLFGFLEDKKLTYEEYLLEIIQEDLFAKKFDLNNVNVGLTENINKPKKSLFASIFE